jgi:hypothetical protein
LHGSASRTRRLHSRTGLHRWYCHEPTDRRSGSGSRSRQPTRPTRVSGILTNDLPSAKRHEFAALLIELGDLLDKHVDGQGAATADGSKRPDAMPLSPRHALREPPAIPPEDVDPSL